MTMLFSILVVALMTSLAMAPITMFFGRVLLKKTPRFDQALTVCFYAGISIWLVYSLVALYTGEEMVLIPIVFSLIAGYIAYAIALHRVFEIPIDRGMLFGGLLICLTAVVLFVGIVCFSLVFMLYDAHLS